jgi:hypothetical protein
MKQITRRIYLQVINRKGEYKITEQNYLNIFALCDDFFKIIFSQIDTYKIDKSLFLDFMNFQMQLNYCFEMMIENEMTTKEIHDLMDKEKEYLNFIFQSITNLDISDL